MLLLLVEDLDLFGELKDVLLIGFLLSLTARLGDTEHDVLGFLHILGSEQMGVLLLGLKLSEVGLELLKS